MVNQYKTIDYGWLTKPTGDPFADVGGYVIKYLDEQHPEKNILEHIEYLANIYIYKWEGKINPFFLNSPITQPAFKGHIKIEETIKYYTSLLNETMTFEVGYCRITGRKTKLFKAGRENSLLSGSGAFVNFHHNFQLGMMLSKEMLIRMFFIPYGSIFVGGKIAIIQSNENKINEFFTYNICKANDGNLSRSFSKGILKSEYGIPANSLFRFVEDLLRDQKDLLINQIQYPQDLALTLYHFTNFGASPEIVIYKLPANVFKFYSICQNIIYKTDWQPFLMAHYTNSKYKGAKYNPTTVTYELRKKGEIEQITLDDFKTWHNIVLDKLLNDESILGLFVTWGMTHKFNIKIVELYQKYIQNMRKETLDKIKDLALFLTNADEDAIKKNIRALDGSKNPYDLRRFLLKKVVVPNYNKGADSTIITVDELVYYLFPDDISWRDIRDILLFAIYQDLHAKNMHIKTELSNEEDNTSEEK
jgi:CRISPR-associated protein Cst1